MSRTTFATGITQIGPPWLQRTTGGKLVGAIGDVFDDLITRTSEGVQMRFPTDSPDPDALAHVGKDRRIRRGIGETATEYARRLRPWLAAHKRRGSPYALLEQLYTYLHATVPPPYDLVAYSGLRHSVDVNGVITRDQIAWSGDGSGKWARIWIYFYVGTDPGVLTEDQKEVYRAIPREWNAAHIEKTTIVLVWGPVWGYPPGRLWGDPGLWGAGGTTQFTVE